MRLRSLLLALAAALAFPAAAQARDATITSFDGTQIVLSFFPAAGLPPGQRAPTVLEGHGWGGSRDTDENSASSEQTGNVGVGPLRRAGFNVLTWDARGFGQVRRHRGGRLAGRRGARRQRADRLAGQAA